LSQHFIRYVEAEIREHLTYVFLRDGSRWDLGHAPAGACSLTQFISAGCCLPSASRADISKLERAVRAGRGTQQLATVHTLNTLRRRWMTENGSNIPRSTHSPLRSAQAELHAWGDCLQTKRGARGGVTSFLPSFNKKDGRRERRLVTGDSSPTAVRGPIRVSPSGGTRVLHPHALARAVQGKENMSVPKLAFRCAGV
jgi:hypothetical protein